MIISFIERIIEGMIVLWENVFYYYVFQMLSIHEQAFMRGFRNGTQLRKGFLADDGRKDLNTNKSGPSLASQQNAISMAIKTCQFW